MIACSFLTLVFLLRFDGVPAIGLARRQDHSYTYGTSPNSNGEFNFLILGDWGGPDEEARVLVGNAMEAVATTTDSKFVLSTGDNFYYGIDPRDGTDYYWDGIRDVNDIKWTNLWKDTYRGKLSEIPWYVVQGNHDWRGNPHAQVQFAQKDPLWVHPDFFWEKVIPLPKFNSTTSVAGRIEVPPEQQQQQEAAFIFIDTQLLAYGYEPDEKEEPGLTENFRRLGWVPHAQTIEAHFKWIENALERHKDKAYTFVVGHHPIGVCKGEGLVPSLMQMFQRYQLTAYFFGHVHAMEHARAENTFYVESGAGSKRSKPCQDGPLSQTPGAWSVGGVNGFARGVLDRGGFSVEYYDQDAQLLHKSEQIGPRAMAKLTANAGQQGNGSSAGRSSGIVLPYQRRYQKMLTTASALSLIILLQYVCNPTSAQQSRRNDAALEFLIIGDWGNPNGVGQHQVAQGMEQLAARTSPQFIISTGNNYLSGDRFSYDGVNSLNDPKWSILWKQTYRGALTQLPWWVTSGPRDWSGKPKVLTEYSKIDPRWTYPNFFWETVIRLPAGVRGPNGQLQEAAFIFIDTNLVHYGYEPTQERRMAANFVNQNWTPQRRALEDQINWIDSTLEKHKDKPFVFVVGHHPVAMCRHSGNMTRLYEIFQKHRITAYLYGHVRTLQNGKVENTLYVNSGAGSVAGERCPNREVNDVEDVWIGERMRGFARGVLDSRGFRVEYHDHTLRLIFSSALVGSRMGDGGSSGFSITIRKNGASSSTGFSYFWCGWLGALTLWFIILARNRL
ncbi:Tartrate-resistant acid phosphatase type 5 [Quaeritorhiza haematococci]|nr:Tartrate-resistant acid phosphatase type 5 [Quaeritorhiza haematococci]